MITMHSSPRTGRPWGAPPNREAIRRGPQPYGFAKVHPKGTRWEAPSSRLWRLADATPNRGLSWSVFSAGLFLLLVVSAAGFLYIRQTISTAASGYGVSALERRDEKLREEEVRLQFDVAKFQSLQRLQEYLPKLNLVPAQKAVYTSPLLGPVVTGRVPVGTGKP